MRQSILNVGAIALLASFGPSASAGLLASWNFESNQFQPYQSSVINLPPDAGVPSNSANLAIQTYDPQSTMSLDAGNGSLRGLTATRWSTGDFLEVNAVFLPTGPQTFTFTWDQTRSAFGPADFRVEVSFDEYNTFTTVPGSAYTAINAGALLSGTNEWSATGAQQTAFTRSVTFSGTVTPQSSAGLGGIVVRLVATGNPGDGWARFDNISLTSSTIPAPGALALLGLAGLTGRRRRGEHA